jgi:hypothetical protein
MNASSDDNGIEEIEEAIDDNQIEERVTEDSEEQCGQTGHSGSGQSS